MPARGQEELFVEDNLCRKYDLHFNQFIGSEEFYFTLKEPLPESYTITIPEIHVVYFEQAKVKFPVPDHIEEVNKNVELSGFEVIVTKVERVGDTEVRVYVDVENDENSSHVLKNFRLEGRSYMSYSNPDTFTVEYFQFAIEPEQKSIKLTFENPEVTIRGPWKLELNQEDLLKK